jgi:hypothetical protein
MTAFCADDVEAAGVALDRGFETRPIFRILGKNETLETLDPLENRLGPPFCPQQDGGSRGAQINGQPSRTPPQPGGTLGSTPHLEGIGLAKGGFPSRAHTFRRTSVPMPPAPPWKSGVARG